MDSTISATANQPAGNFRSSFLLWLIWILWLPLFIPSLVSLAQSHPSPARLSISILGAIAFFALYLWMSWQAARTLAAPAPRTFPTGVSLWAPVVALVALGIGFTLIDGYSWGTLLIYTSSGVSGWLPGRKAVPVVFGLVLFIAVILGIKGHIAEAISPMGFVGIVGAIVIAFGWSIANSQRLRIAREEMAQAAAINEERLRIARDLHDLLGHNLSLIALKSELARRLVDVAPDRAASELSDIEVVARKALREVREAVASYRQPTLAGELQGAREMLAAAGIGFRYEGETNATPMTSGLPPEVESMLSWAVREGVTNVIRHSGAHQCTIRVSREPSDIRIEVIDDGHGSLVTDTGDSVDVGASGNGLRGLAERVAALGGSMEAGQAGNGGFRLSVAAPLAKRSPRAVHASA